MTYREELKKMDKDWDDYKLDKTRREVFETNKAGSGGDCCRPWPKTRPPLTRRERDHLATLQSDRQAQAVSKGTVTRCPPPGVGPYRKLPHFLKQSCAVR